MVLIHRLIHDKPIFDIIVITLKNVIVVFQFSMIVNDKVPTYQSHSLTACE